MENGRAVLSGPLSADHAQVLSGIHMQGDLSGNSPYFSLSDLAQHWPSTERGVRREVVLVTNGMDPFNPRYDGDDVYVDAAIADSARAGLVVYSIYWSSRNGTNASSLNGASGQNYLAQLTQATGGYSYWYG